MAPSFCWIRDELISMLVALKRMLGSVYFLILESISLRKDCSSATVVVINGIWAHSLREIDFTSCGKKGASLCIAR